MHNACIYSALWFKANKIYYFVYTWQSSSVQSYFITEVDKTEVREVQKYASIT